MEHSFPHNLSALRKSRGLSQRKAAGDLGISQALLSHYENGAREPGLAFVVRVCDYYGVSADYLLGRSDQPSSGARQAEQLRRLARALEDLAKEAADFADSPAG